MKRFLSICLAFLMVLFMMPTVAKAASENITITVSADKTTAYRGDTINYTVTIGSVSSLSSLDFNLSVPSGLTINDASIAIPDGLKDTLHSAFDIVIPSASDYAWSYMGTSPYSGSDLVVLTFSCTVDAECAYEAKTVTLSNVLACDELATEHSVTVTPASATIARVPVHVSGVTLNKDTLSLKVGDNDTLIPTISPADADTQTVSWSSSNPSVASVANGTVTANGIGSTVITVTTDDQSKTATCSVTVTCNHSMVETPAQTPTCGDDGNIQYWTCSNCGKKFSDVGGNTEVADVVDPATGLHGTTELRNVVAATEETTGYSGDTYCTVCNHKIADGTVTQKLPHTHLLNKTDRVEPTCTVPGNIEYWTCSKCHKMYSDVAGNTEVSDVSIPATGHTASATWTTDASDHWKVCSDCGTIVTDKVAHTFTWKLDTPATTTENGTKHEECSCGYKRNEGTVIPSLSHEHSGIEYHAAVAENCTEDGTIEYWTCGHDDCAGKYYADEACQLELTSIAVPADPSKHVYDNASDAFCNKCDYQRFYVVIEGANTTYNKAEASSGLRIRVDGDYALFQGVKVDGTLVAVSNYTTASGSTIIIFKPGYLSTLGNGVHAVEVLYTDGKTASTNFTIKNEVISQNGGENGNSEEANSEDTSSDNSSSGEQGKSQSIARSPKTGADGFGSVWMMILAICGIATMVTSKKSMR